MWTAFDYMYRDAANFKVFGSIAFGGHIGQSDRARIQSRLDGGEYFVAEQVGVPPLYEQLYRWSSGPTSSDHCWHEFIGFRELNFVSKEQVGSVDATAFVARFSSLSRWDCALSPHFDLE